MAGRRVHVVMPSELVRQIDELLRAGESRGEFMRLAACREANARGATVERALSEAKEPSAPKQADPGSVSSSEGVRSAAPAEQSRAELFRRATQR